MQRIKSPLTALLAAGLLIMATGCSSLKDVKFQETGLESPTLRFSKNLSETLSLEVEHARVKGDGVRILDDPDERIDLDELTIIGPAELSTEFELKTTKLGLGVTFLERETVSLMVDFGLSQADLDLLFKDGPTRHDFEQDNRGAYGRFQVAIPLAGHLSASAHAGLTKFFDQDVGYMSDIGIELSLSLGENVDIFAGWFNWVYQNEDNRSDIEIDAEGVAYGVHFTF